MLTSSCHFPEDVMEGAYTNARWKWRSYTYHVLLPAYTHDWGIPIPCHVLAAIMGSCLQFALEVMDVLTISCHFLVDLTGGVYQFTWESVEICPPFPATSL